MKRSYRLLPLLLACVLLLGVLPAGVSAATSQPIKKIELTGVTAPSAGSIPDFNTVTCSTPGCSVGGAGTLIHWYSSPGNSSWTSMNSHGGSDERFQYGYYYRSVFVIELNRAGGDYYFEDNITATVNGRSASARKITTDTYTCVEVTMNWGQLVKGTVSSVDVTIPAPVPGEQPAPAAWSVPDGANYRCWSMVHDIQWSRSADGETWERMIDPEGGPVEPFGYGLYYKAETLIIASEGYRFSSTPEVRVNGSAAVILNSGYDSDSALVNYRSYWLQIEYVFEPAPLTALDAVELQVTEPLFGNTADHSIFTLNTEHVSLTGADTELHWYRSLDGTDWKKMHNVSVSEDGTASETDHVFAAGWYYKLETTVSADEGYEFSDDTAVTVNGRPAGITNRAVFDGSPILNIEAVWEPRSDRTVSVIEISEVVAPAVNASPDENTCSLPDSCGYSVLPLPTALLWYAAGSDDNWIRVENTDVFAPGTPVMVRVSVRADEGVLFSDRLQFTLNGMNGVIDSVRYHDEGPDQPAGWYAVCSFCFDGPAAEEITAVKITGVSEPAVGETPDHSCKLPKNAGYAIVQPDGVTWEVSSNGKSWKVMDEDEPFEAGLHYRIRISVEAEEGYLLSAGCTATVNGEKAKIESVTIGISSDVICSFGELEDSAAAPSMGSGGSRTIAGIVVSAAGGIAIIAGAFRMGKFRTRKRRSDFQFPDELPGEAPKN